MADFGRFEALSFDCYGTLIDWEDGIATELDGWAHHRGVAVSPDELVELFASVETSVQAEHPAMRYPQILEHTLRRIADRLGAEVGADDLAGFGASVGRWPAFPDSAEALARLKRRFKLIILSNVDRASFAASNARLGVEFDLVVTAEDVGAYKPSPLSFPALLERIGSIGVSRNRLLHVAQSLYHDHEPARAAGIPALWIDRRHAREGFGATPPPQQAVVPQWRYSSLAAFADDAVG